MVAPSAGSVVLVPFPFSNLSQSKLRPAVVLAAADKDDYILCQITSNSYADTNAVKIQDADFSRGSLQKVSHARPSKLFTANVTLMVQEAGVLKTVALQRIIEKVIEILQSGLKT